MNTQNPHGLIDQSELGRKNDYLYRISTKSLIKNSKGEVLVVKESGRTWWDLPGGGMDHAEDVKSAIARELKEEINLECNFSYEVIAVDDPVYLPNANLYQVRIIFHVIPEKMKFSADVDADDIQFMDVSQLKESHEPVERKVLEYARLVSGI